MKYEGLELWERVEKSDARFLKKVEYGKRSFVTIDAYYQIKVATGIFGPYGKAWGLKNTSLEIVSVGETPMAIYKATFYYPEGEFEIWNAIKISDDEFAKKVETDTLTKALSRLGFNADVFLGMYDGNRYTQNTQKSANDQPAKEPSEEDVEKLIEILKKSGVEIKKRDKKIIATGKTYQNSSLLKKLGFKWDASEKVWAKEVA